MASRDRSDGVRFSGRHQLDRSREPLGSDDSDHTPAGGADHPVGLTSEEALRRHRAGQGNTQDDRTARSVASIIRANVLTRFNAIISSLTLVVLVFGDPIDAVFGLVMVLNSVIGVSQELRAKRSLDALQVLMVPSIRVFRDGELHKAPPADLVLGDVIVLESGDQVPVDGRVEQSNGLEVDESALTGESVPVAKPVGSQILSGSFVVVGGATVEATAVGATSWAAKLTAEAKDFVLTRSELRVGVDGLLRIVSWLLPPLAILLAWSQLRAEATISEGLVSAVAGVVALVPQGLVLLVSMTFAVAVLRLGREQVVVQELPAVEGLARVDVLCVDKTGTLTTGRLSVDRVEPVGPPDPELRAGLAALAQLETARSTTTDALKGDLAADLPDWTVDRAVPFSSVRKWSGATFAGHGTWILGAPEILLDAADGDGNDELRATIDDLASSGRRVLLVARSEAGLADDERLPGDLRPTGMVTIREEVRPDAAETIEYFRRQHVEIKVLSGDNPRTVASVAAELGIEGADRHVDLRTHANVADIEPTTTVFGRVLPEQKRDIVRLLQDQGHTVAMTGDGVNDIPSLKASDIGIAMNTATPATKAIAQLVLLDGRFDRLPGVVAEGRRVIANMERVSCLFVTKTVYATLLALAVAIAGVSFPFLPRHLSLIGALTIGIPGFVLSFVHSEEPSRSGYIQRVLRFSIPAGIISAGTTYATYWAAGPPLGDADLTQARTAATVAMTLTGLWILYRLVRPMDLLRAGLLGAMLAALVVALIPAPWSDFYALELPSPRMTAILAVVWATTLVGLQATLSIGQRLLFDRRPDPRTTADPMGLKPKR